MPTREDERRGFEELWKANAGLMKRVCARWVAHRADDAFSQATLVAFRKFSQCNVSSPAWLMRVTRNVCIDLHRDDARRRTQTLDDENGRGLASTLPAPSGDPERLYLQRERASIVFRCLVTLPARLREPLLLHAMLGYEHARVAETLSITNACARKRISEARSRLRECVQGTKPDAEAVQETDWWAAAEKLASEITRRAADATAIPIALATTVTTIRRGDGSERDVTLFHAEAPATFARLEPLRAHVARYGTGYVKACELARLLRAAGRFEDAIPHYERVLERRPALTTIAFELADVQRALGDVAGAILVLERARLHARPADVPLVEAQLARFAGRRGSAATILRTALQDATARGDLWLLLAETLFENGEVAEAVSAFESAAQLRPQDARTLVGAHDALLAAGAPRAAGVLAKRILELDPRNPAALLRVAESDAGAIESAIAAAPDAAAGHVLRALAAARAGGFEAGRAALQPFLHVHAAHVDGWLGLARVFLTGNAPARAASAARLTLLFARSADDDDVRTGAACVLAAAADREWRVRIAEVETLTRDWRLMIAASRALADVVDAVDLRLALTREATFAQPHLAPSWAARARALTAADEITAAAAAVRVALAKLGEGEMFDDLATAAAEIAVVLRAAEDPEASAWDDVAARCEKSQRASVTV